MRKSRHQEVMFHLRVGKSARGFLTIFVLIVSALFLVLLADLMDVLTVERAADNIGADSENALHMAEAGLEYYRWHFAQFPSDLKDGTGVSGPYVHTVKDPQNNADAGTFSLDVSGINSCGVLTSASVRSTGSMLSAPAHTTTLLAQYGKLTLAASTSPAKVDGTVTTNLTNLKTYAQASGVYLPAAGTGKYGYKIVFNSNGTFDASPVNSVTQIWGYSTDDGWQQEKTIIATTGAAVNHSIPSGCPVVFVEDNVWLQGTVSGKVTLVAASPASLTVDPDIVLTDSVTYAHAYDDGLTAIAEHSLLLSLQSPDVMQLSGVYVAVKGHFGRHRYDSSGTHAVPASLRSTIMRSTLNTFGTFASKGAIDIKWTSSGTFISGYSIETDVHDALLAELPPPFTPTISESFNYTDWRAAN